MTKAKTSTYTGGTVKKGLAGVRERLSVYIGSTGVLSEGHMPRALAQMAQETISNSLDEFVAGYGDEIAVTINSDGSMTVYDHGRGLPKGPNTEFTNVINMMTEPHGSGKFDDSAYAALGVAGMNGLGMKAVNAGSKKLVVEACCTASKPNPDDPSHPLPRNYLEEYRIEFKQDRVLKREIVKKKSDGPTYTRVTFWPDDGPTSDTKPEPVLESVDWIVDDLKPRLEASAFLMPGVRITLDDKREGREQSLEWCYERGLEDYLEQLLEGSVTLPSMEGCPVVVDKTVETADGVFQLRAAFTYTESIGADIVSFANGVPTSEGGPHLDGFRKALLDTFNEFSSTRKLSKKKLSADDVVDGLVAVFETRVPSKIADFEGQTKEKLATVQAKDTTASMLSEALAQWLFENEKAGKEIVSKMVESASARDAAMRARKEAKEARKAKTSSGLDLKVSSKLKACSSRNPEERELFITEGDSASGFKRDVRTQAIFPLRGKILNIYKADIGRALKNEEISTIVSVLGSGIGPTFNVDEMQYGKVIIACFTGDTRVKCLDGNSYSFNELVENGVDSLWVYALDKAGNMVPALARGIRQTGMSRELVEIELDNGTTFRCTPDHMLLDVDGRYVRADSISEGDSLMPLHTRFDNGYEEFYDAGLCDWVKTYRRVAEVANADERVDAENRLANERHRPQQNCIQVHHRDFDKRNNLPENLAWLTSREHFHAHGEEGWSVYNRSEKHKQRVRELWASGHYANATFNANGYNGSDYQKECLANARARGCYDGTSHFNNWNYSDEHNEVIRRVNSSKAHIDSVDMSKIAKSIKYLMLNGLEICEQIFDYYKMPGAPRWSRIEELFDGIDDAIEYTRDNFNELDMSNFVPNCEYQYQYDNNRKQRTQIAKVIKKVWENGLELSEATYNSTKGSRTIAWENITKWFDSIEDAIEYARELNHSVKRVIKLNSKSNEPVYCLTVPKYHNFLLENGVFVKNCDQDVDGSHIKTLCTGIFYKFFPGLIDAGRLYVVDTPLYKATRYVKGQIETRMFYSESEMAAAKDEIDGWDISRFKGLGEMDKNTEAYEAITNPATRHLTRITQEDARRSAKMLKTLLGPDSAPRKKWLEENVDFSSLD